jgi:hypothetical protein
MPDKYKGTAREIVGAYLNNTPFESVFYAGMPLLFSDEQRFEHAHVVGGTGHGKTQLLQRLIIEDLARENPPALVIVDSQGEMLRKVQQLAVFASGKPLSDRLIIIDPEDVDHPPALNMFDLRARRLGGYSQTIKEQIEATTIENFNYVFGALAAELTSKQNTTFAFVTRLLLSIPGATVHTLRELFEDGAKNIDASPFAKYIKDLALLVLISTIDPSWSASNMSRRFCFDANIRSNAGTWSTPYRRLAICCFVCEYAVVKNWFLK